MRRTRTTAATTLPVVVLIVVGLLVGGVAIGRANRSAPPADLARVILPEEPTPTPTPTLAPLPLHPQNEVVGNTPWWSWAMVDRRTGESWGSENQEEGSHTASMVKAWFAALYLREHPEPTQSWLDRLSVMIRDSDNLAADATHLALGGNGPVISAMMSICGVSATAPGQGWGSTTVSAHQQALLGACIAAGKVANPQWTAWLLNEMRLVRGEGDFGIRLAFPEEQRPGIAVKNGWVSGSVGWWVNCMAIGDTWVLVIETRSASYGAGAQSCVSITEQLMRDPLL